MGGVVKSIVKPFRKIGSGLVKSVGGLLGSITGQGAPSAPQVVQMPAPAVQVQEAPVATPEKDTEEGMTTKQANRKGKQGLTIKRTGMGGGSGTNI